MTEYVPVKESAEAAKQEANHHPAQWTPAHIRGNSLLEMWAAWSRSDPNKLGYPHAQPFAKMRSGRGRTIIGDELAERIDGAVVRMPKLASTVVIGYYLGERHDAFSLESVLSAIMEFLNEFDV